MSVMEKLHTRAEIRTGGWPHTLTSDVAYLRTGIVNVILYGRPGAPSGSWVLIDAGLPGSAGRIMHAAEEWIGPWARPAAVVLTHGHFDHVGALSELVRHWDVPVYAHHLELPYLTGRSSYPPPDPTVGGGALAAMSRVYPQGPIDLGSRVQVLPEDGSVPGMPGWRWIHTPGHTPGHVSLFREQDRCLVAGDAVVTTKQESAASVVLQRRELHGPPAYFTPDWSSAGASVRAIAALRPERLVTGHGQPMAGESMREELDALAEHFDAVERPRFGRYARQPALADESGVVMLPPDPLPKILAGVGLAAAMAAVGWAAARPRRTERARA